MAENPEGLDESLDSFEAGCLDLGLKVDRGVRTHIEGLFRKSFEKNEEEWKKKGHLVLEVARFAGRYAAAFASLQNRSRVDTNDANRGLIEAKLFCVDNRKSARNPNRREWCRGVGIPRER